MARNLPQLTLKATGKLNKHSLNRLKEVIELQRNLYNSSLAIINLAKAQGRDLIAVEDLQISNMTSTARGTSTNPGRNVRAKSGLNRSILQQGWAEILTMLAYKARKAGIRFISVCPARSSQTCSNCGIVDHKSRRTQEHFACIACGHEENADINASRVIAQRGLAKLRERALKSA